MRLTGKLITGGPNIGEATIELLEEEALLIKTALLEYVFKYPSAEGRVCHLLGEDKPKKIEPIEGLVYKKDHIWVHTLAEKINEIIGVLNAREK